MALPGCALPWVWAGLYNLIAMELETSDLIYIARHLADSTIAISATTPTGPREHGYTEDHLDHFLSAAPLSSEVLDRLLPRVGSVS